MAYAISTAGHAGGVLPDAGALDAGAYAWHRIGATGRDVRVGLSDSGVGAAVYFAHRAYRVEGRRADNDGHGTGMAAVMLAVAPDVTVVSRPAGAAALVDLLHRRDLDLVLCAWGVAGTHPDVDFRFGPPVIAADVGLPGVWPAAARGVTAVGVGDGAPSGPYRLPGGRHRWSGSSVAAAVCCGRAALAISAGLEPRAAVRLARLGDFTPRLLKGSGHGRSAVDPLADHRRHARRGPV